MLVKLYRDLIPSTVRQSLYDAFLGDTLFFLRHFKVHFRSKLAYFFGWLLPKTDENKAWAFIGKYGITSYPHQYSLDYKNRKVSVLVDENSLLPYVWHNEKKLFFPKTRFSHSEIERLYISLITEQDPRSAHRYVNSYDELKGKTLLDIGSAEGIFSLDVIDKVEHVYLFEYEEFWQEALKTTFAPWNHKVTIVRHYVSDKSEGIYTTIDDFLKDKTKNQLFLKMDIEGAEQSALRGAIKTLNECPDIQLAVCTYHRQDDPKVISELLSSLGFTYEFTEGVLYWGKRLNKALIRGKKTK
jgi:hypothetical protein